MTLMDSPGSDTYLKDSHLNDSPCCDGGLVCTAAKCPYRINEAVRETEAL